MTDTRKQREYLTESDMHMLIEVLDGLEESYNLDIKEGIDRHEDTERQLIPWARRVRRIIAQDIEEATRND